jgi:hypothetical protein
MKRAIYPATMAAILAVIVILIGYGCWTIWRQENQFGPNNLRLVDRDPTHAVKMSSNLAGRSTAQTSSLR